MPVDSMLGTGISRGCEDENGAVGEDPLRVDDILAEIDGEKGPPVAGELQGCR